MPAVEATSVPLHDPGLALKMEDRKRPAASDNATSAPPLKKQATSANGSASRPHPDADMPWRDDLERIQKDAILRQMHEYKRERNTLETRLKELEITAAYHDDHLRVIDAWLKQLIDEIRVMLFVQDDEQQQSQQQNELASFPTSLFFAQTAEFENHLKDHAGSIKSIVSGLISRASKPSADVADLQAQITWLLAEQKATQVTLEKSIAEKQQLEERLDAASLRYMVAEKKIDRARSITVAKVEKQDILGSQKKPSTTTTTTTTTTTAQTSQGASTSNGSGASSERVRELEELQNRSKVVLEKQTEQLKKLEAENAKLLSQVTELNVKFTKLSDEDYAQTDLCKQLKSQHADIIKRINHLEAVNVQLREEAQTLQAERTAYRIQIENESQAVMSEKENQISKLESDLTRVRNARDELLADQAIKKAFIDQERTAATHSEDLLEARDARIAALESEVERLQLRIDGLKDSENDENGDDLETLRTNYKTLDKQYAMLNQELSSMQQAFRKTSKLAGQKISDLKSQEEKIQRFAAEKAKADQKYFAAMKSKEAREHELIALRIQNAKSSDIISQLKDAETTTRSLLSNVEKQLAETKEALVAATSQSSSSQQQATEANIAIQGLHSQISELKKVASARDSSLVSAQNASRKYEQEIAELKVTVSETKKSLESWRSKGSGHQSTEAEMLRALAVCTVCRQNFKNTVIKTCGHVFCRECVEERLTSRSRKCPNCNKSFGNNDYMHITL
ncbi:E3 ubiquitin-protein ligase bre1 [Ascosphaera aggregata]|nr:E3 ubiquitin-protein ligase bre1 [Ascosphaera aggregata]